MPIKKGIEPIRYLNGPPPPAKKPVLPKGLPPPPTPAPRPTVPVGIPEPPPVSGKLAPDPTITARSKVNISRPTVKTSRPTIPAKKK